MTKYLTLSGGCPPSKPKVFMLKDNLRYFPSFSMVFLKFVTGTINWVSNQCMHREETRKRKIETRVPRFPVIDQKEFCVCVGPTLTYGLGLNFVSRFQKVIYKSPPHQQLKFDIGCPGYSLKSSLVSSFTGNRHNSDWKLFHFFSPLFILWITMWLAFFLTYFQLLSNRYLKELIIRDKYGWGWIHLAQKSSQFE